MENVEEWKEINWNYMAGLYNNASLSGSLSTYLGDFLDRIPKHLWKSKTIWKHSLLSLACGNGDEGAVVKLLLHCRYSVNKLSRHASVVIPSYPRILEIILATGFKFEFDCDINDLAKSCGQPNDYEAHIRTRIPKYAKCLRIIMSYGFRLEKSKIRSVPKEFVRFQNGLNLCRNIIVTLLGLKKRQHVLLKRLDRFLVKQVLAVEIWSTRCDETWQRINGKT